jgi:hypothetical protein
MRLVVAPIGGLAKIYQPTWPLARSAPPKTLQ